MPPRKRAKASQPASPSITSQGETPTAVEDASPPTGESLSVNDPWTDEEEIALFNALMGCKPTGIHKHFHLFAVHQELLDGGHIHPKNDHTKPAGIWRKLETLYDLNVLDEREDARQLEKLRIPEDYRGNSEDAEEESSSGKEDDIYSEAANKIVNDDFDLPGDAFAEEKWMRRLATEKQRRADSPPLLPELNMADLAPTQFVPSFSIESSEAATPRSKAGRVRAAATGSKETVASKTRKSARNVESETEEPEDDDAEENEDEEQSEENDSDEEEDQSERSTPARRGTRKSRGKPTRVESKARIRTRGRAR